MRALITGGAGFIGSHLAAELRRQGIAVRVLDDFRTGRRDNLAGLEVDVREGSILDELAVRTAMEEVDLVFHLAALVSVPESVAQPRACVGLNVLGLLNVLEAAAAARVKRLCFASSAAVYGSAPEVPKREDMAPDPRSPYAVTKLDGEYYCRQFAEDGRLETVALRFFNVFGPRQNPAGPYGAAVASFFRDAAAGGPLVIHGDGEQTRDFVYVQDIVDALVFAARRDGLTGVYNAGYGRQTTVRELAERIIGLTGSRSELRFAPARAGDVRHSLASIDRLRAAGWEPAGTFEEGLERTWEALRVAAGSTGGRDPVPAR